MSAHAAKSLAPVIETERLVLRGHQVSDFEETATMFARPEMFRYITGKPNTREEAWWRLLRMFGHWHAWGFGFWAIEEKASGRLVGEAGFLDMKREITPSLEDKIEMGWSMAPEVQGRGYVTEACRAQIAWLEKLRGSIALYAIVHPDNAPSLRVADRLGFHEIARTTYKNQPTVMLRRDGKE
jgi:RimJ/RimL family protein N-acetyltransferase